MGAWEAGPFLLSAAPGAGKTRPALELARRELERGSAASGRRGLPDRPFDPAVGTGGQ